MRLPALCTAVLLPLLWVGPAWSFPQATASSQPCADCHKLTVDEAQTLLKGLVEKVLHVEPSPVPGLWVVDVERGNQKGPLYIDYSKKFLFSGTLMNLETKQDFTKERYVELNRVDPSSIPLGDAVVVGDPAAAIKVIVFDDPECPYCKKLQPAMNEVVKERKDVAFFIKMLPLKIHPNAREKAKAIVCAKSLQLLEDSLAGKSIPAPSCETDQIEKNEALAAQLGVRSTPTLIFPDGRVIPGYKPADQILAELTRGAQDKGQKAHP
jgi:thiol:disulfide interchange protein DsbC